MIPSANSYLQKKLTKNDKGSNVKPMERETTKLKLSSSIYHPAPSSFSCHGDIFKS